MDTQAIAERMAARYKMLQAQDGSLQNLDPNANDKTLVRYSPSTELEPGLAKVEQFRRDNNLVTVEQALNAMQNAGTSRQASALETAEALDAVQEPAHADNLRAAVSDPHQFTDAVKAVNFILGGNAIVTFVSKMTGTRYTFKVNKPKPDPTGRWNNNGTYFVSLLSGPQNTSNYRYLGMIRDGQFRLTSASFRSGITNDTPSVVAFAWTWGQIQQHKMNPGRVEIWHEGRCGRCSRVLTVPESIASGFGPECITKL